LDINLERTVRDTFANAKNAAEQEVPKVQPPEDLQAEIDLNPEPPF